MSTIGDDRTDATLDPPKLEKAAWNNSTLIREAVAEEIIEPTLVDSTTRSTDISTYRLAAQ